ncbi:MAG: hypothetical protein Q7S56_02610 [Nanoarchaeota archaeon]|nr:hypothetical protein [Nanoarchaeota archaeon]
MNFKPTLWKTILSIIVGVLIYLYPLIITRSFDDIAGVKYLFTSWMGLFFILGIIAFFVIYVVWSLFQKKS